jgi:hypothetical protein
MLGQLPLAHVPVVDQHRRIGRPDIEAGDADIRADASEERDIIEPRLLQVARCRHSRLGMNVDPPGEDRGEAQIDVGGSILIVLRVLWAEARVGGGVDPGRSRQGEELPLAHKQHVVLAGQYRFFFSRFRQRVGPRKVSDPLIDPGIDRTDLGESRSSAQAKEQQGCSGAFKEHRQSPAAVGEPR